MIVDRDIAKYIVFAEDSILNALSKISANKRRVVFSVTESGVLEGILTDGDFRRWLMAQHEIDLNRPVSHASNKSYRFVNATESPDLIANAIDERIQFVPLLDRQRHLVAIAWAQAKTIRIGDFEISEDSPCFIVAEIGNNHNGSMELARRLVDLAADAGANCAKFQMRRLEQLYRNRGSANDASEDLGSQYTLDLLSRFQLRDVDLIEIFDYCRTRNILPLCTPWDKESLAVLQEYDMPAYKVASADLTNHELLEAMSGCGKPLLVSTGMSTEAEIQDAVRLMRRSGTQYVLLHCNSTYPAPFKDLNLAYLKRLKEIGDCPVGYSGHERGISVPIAAVARGAKVVEKHFTIDRNLEGNDHRVSLLPEEFAAMVQGIREVEQAIGQEKARRVSQGELMNREVLGKSLVARCDIARGQVITAEMVDIKSPGKGLAPYRKNELVDKPARRDVKAGDFFFSSDIDAPKVAARAYRFSRPFGIPVRYHDALSMAGLSNFDLMEFHLSYKDLEDTFSKYLTRPFDYDLVVHSPELFAGDHIMDLSSRDRAYRERSIAELQRVVDLTRALTPLFRKATKPLIIINAGGFTLNAFLKPVERKAMYDAVAESLNRIDSKGVEIVPQTMPPFPWLFGGQRYHNLFVEANEIVEFCRQNSCRVCLDLSHSKLACNHLKRSFDDFLGVVGPYSAHLHVVDAAGTDSEGLQIGEGEIDFQAAGKLLARAAPNASFVPEIWQGHKNEGEGFWVALDRLEGCF